MNTEPPNPPHCPTWCERGPHGWDTHPAAVTKTCEKTVEACHDVDGQPVTVHLARFAQLDGHRVTADPPTVTLDVTGHLAPSAVFALAVVLADLAHAVQAGQVAA